MVPLTQRDYYDNSMAWLKSGILIYMYSVHNIYNRAYLYFFLHFFSIKSYDLLSTKMMDVYRIIFLTEIIYDNIVIICLCFYILEVKNHHFLACFVLPQWPISDSLFLVVCHYIRVF